MHPWERRLKDLAHLLNSCHEVYFEPNLFRMNTNQFLQTARTVTFIIQKNKYEIQDFDIWYEQNVVTPWKTDELMQWAKDSRNKIEKQGDLELHSTIQATLIFSYIEDQDVALTLGRSELLEAGIKKLIRLAQKELPTGVADAAFIKVERKWVANSLETWELLEALTYVYSRIFDACVKLSAYLDKGFEVSIPEPTSFDQANADSRQIRYFFLNGQKVGSYRTSNIQLSKDFEPPIEIREAMRQASGGGQPKSLAENVQLFSKFAKITFNSYGNHLQMLFLFDDQYRVIDYITTHFEATADKYVFWRRMAEQIAYQKPHSLIWISELWKRKVKVKEFPTVAIRNMEIEGEALHVCGMDRAGNFAKIEWDIPRQDANSIPELVPTNLGDEIVLGEIPNFLIPIAKAFGVTGSAVSGA